MLLLCLPTLLLYTLLLAIILRFIKPAKKNTIAFIHPNAAARGGGEKVLWAMVQALRKHTPSLEIIIYLRGDEPLSDTQILAATKKTFNVDLMENPPAFVRIHCSKLADPHKYKFLTLVLEAAGSIAATFEGLWRFTPEFCVDTTGYGFALFLPRLLFGVTTFAYIHYPIISSDMIGSIGDGEAFNNRAAISKSAVLKKLKKVYYHVLLAFYRFSVSMCTHVWANSTWTRNHIGKQAAILYPPCDTVPEQLVDFESPRPNTVVSIGQFRPEKNHPELVRAFASFVKNATDADSHGRQPYELVMIGGCRNDDDEKRLELLKNLATDLGIADRVHFKPNLPYPQLQAHLRTAKIGIHTMKNEHFGIVVVEFQANGAIALAHNSAGPKEDIVQTDGKYGYLASTTEEFTQKLKEISKLDDSELSTIRRNAYDSCQRFSHTDFVEKFGEFAKKLVNS